MKIETRTIRRQTTAGTDLLDITHDVRRAAEESGVRDGLVSCFVAGSTGALTAIEYEDGVVEDLKRAIERMAPQDLEYDHDRRWGDGNGYSHVRSALLGPSFSVPLSRGALILGTWQQIVLADFDNRPRTREVLVHVIGE